MPRIQLDGHPMQRLVSAVRVALDCPSAQVLEWDERAIEYRVYYEGRTLTRVSGTAHCEGADRAWSLVRKRSATSREAHAYAAPWLASPGFRPATCYIAAGRRALAGGSFSTTTRIGGRSRRSSSRRRHSAASTARPRRAASRRAVAEPGLDRQASGSPALARRPAEHRAQSALREMLDGLPQTICHHDAAKANLFPSAIASTTWWRSTGRAWVGARSRRPRHTRRGHDAPR